MRRERPLGTLLVQRLLRRDMSVQEIAMKDRNTFLQRLIGAAALDTAIYEEVEADENATTQTCATVVLSSLAAGVGARGFGSGMVTQIAFYEGPDCFHAIAPAAYGRLAPRSSCVCWSLRLLS